VENHLLLFLTREITEPNISEYRDLVNYARTLSEEVLE